MHSTIWYHFYNLKNIKNTHEGVLPLVTLHALAPNRAQHPICLLSKITWLKHEGNGNGII